MRSPGIAPGLCFEFTAPFGPDVRDAALDLPKPFAMLRLSMMVIHGESVARYAGVDFDFFPAPAVSALLLRRMSAACARL